MRAKNEPDGEEMLALPLLAILASFGPPPCYHTGREHRCLRDASPSTLAVPFAPTVSEETLNLLPWRVKRL